eukprot:CAMPEP_0172715654 /NCGR_PEP_ID=MMETSP1074-20121228/67671_1 /TAXON_ID=2916 /ORGANISM="Ceratium fusus, Strain PA161109" /LENGTH=134 /DNA_ID=CAMNT_0013540253 /DNA_START=164 /DNA_END=568 /DNA_ORIENTATION=+
MGSPDDLTTTAGEASLTFPHFAPILSCLHASQKAIPPKSFEHGSVMLLLPHLQMHMGSLAVSSTTARDAVSVPTLSCEEPSTAECSALTTPCCTSTRFAKPCDASSASMQTVIEAKRSCTMATGTMRCFTEGKI